MPPIPKSLELKSPRRKKVAPPLSREALLRSVLVACLRRLGLVGHVVPTDLALIALAKDFSENGKERLADDRGRAVDVKPFRFEDCLSPSDPNFDNNLPF